MALSVPAGSYSRNASCALNLMSTSLLWQNIIMHKYSIQRLFISVLDDHVCIMFFFLMKNISFQLNPSWSWSYYSWNCHYPCNQCLSPLKLWVRTSSIARCNRYDIMSQTFVSILRQVSGFLQVLRFLPTVKLTPWFSWNIVESGVKHHSPNPTNCLIIIPGSSCSYFWYLIDIIMSCTYTRNISNEEHVVTIKCLV